MPTTAKYNVITAWRCIGDACRGHVCAAHGSCLHSCLRCSTTPPAKEDLEAGQLISHASTTIRLSALVLEGHRFAVAPIGLGELITSWGEPFRCLACSTERLRQRIWPPQRAFRFGALLSRRSTPSSRDGVELIFAFPAGGAPSGASALMASRAALAREVFAYGQTGSGKTKHDGRHAERAGRRGRGRRRGRDRGGGECARGEGARGSRA